MQGSDLEMNSDKDCSNRAAPEVNFQYSRSKKYKEGRLYEHITHCDEGAEKTALVFT